MRMIKLMCATGVTMVACLTMTGCGSSKPEKAFCKAENRVIPDDELMARALFTIWKRDVQSWQRFNEEVDRDRKRSPKKYQNEPSNSELWDEIKEDEFPKFVDTPIPLETNEMTAKKIINKYFFDNKEKFEFFYNSDDGYDKRSERYYWNKRTDEQKYYRSISVKGPPIHGGSNYFSTCGDVRFFDIG